MTNWFMYEELEKIVKLKAKIFKLIVDEDSLKIGGKQVAFDSSFIKNRKEIDLSELRKFYKNVT